ncbi:hypothetical protein EBU95_02715 [bacterium]|nr:hypothetical protein [bacterium]
MERCENKYEMIANAISSFHLLVVLFVLFAPFLGHPALWILHISFCVTLLVHWWGNSNVCSLSYMESSLRGLDYTQSFTHQFIAPVYDISKTEWSKIVNNITIVLLLLSVYFLYTSDAFKSALECYRQKKVQYKDSPLSKRTLEYWKCFHPLFLLC